MSVSGGAELLDFIAWPSLECLNAQPTHGAANALKQVSPAHRAAPRRVGLGRDPVAAQGYREDDNLWLESDTDEQLLIHIPFNQGAPVQLFGAPAPVSRSQQLAAGRRARAAGAAVKLSGLVVKAAADGHAPRTVKLFTNQPSLGFSEAASEPPTQQFVLSEEDLDGRPLALRRVLPRGLRLLRRS